MAVQGNSSEEKVVKGNSIYTGVIGFKVAGFNLTSDELVELGFAKPKEEPNYLDVQVGNDIFNKITIYLYNDTYKIKTRFDILVKPELVKSAGGKSLFISPFGLNNNKLQSFWAIDQDAAVAHGEQYPAMLNVLNIREAMVGEQTLHEFIYNWLNVKTDSETYLEEFEDIAKGDVSGLNALAKTYKNNVVNLLVGVNDKNYMTIYTGLFMRPSVDSSKLLSDTLTKTKFKANFQNSFKVLEFTPDFVPALEETNATKEEDLFPL